MSTTPVPHDVRSQPRISILNISAILLVLLVAAGLLLHFWWVPRHSTPKFDTAYQAVVLTNGSVYLGKIEGLSTPYPVLRDVYYLQTVTTKDTNQPSNILIKRGKEWHAPDHMVLNRQNIVLIEPVGQNSRVAQLISESK